MRTKQFKAESKKLLDMMINSIYTHKEIFLRELISNASDAMDKLYYRSLSDGITGLSRNDMQIRIDVNKDERTLTITDNGCGMTQQELEQNLGTIAKSGSLDFKTNNEQKEDVDLIGQFGVGFYSAFMVSDCVTVESRAYDSDEAWKWVSKGAEGYTIEPCEKEDHGTVITLHIKPDTENEDYSVYLESYTISTIVKKYSDYIRYPICMDVETRKLKEGSEDEYETVVETKTLNSMVPIWKKNKNEVTDEEYKSFYREKFFDYEDPAKVIHSKVEGSVTYSALLYIPSHAPFDYYSKEYEKGLQLYSSGVMIMDKCADLLPVYFSFVRGLVDSEDLSLNISREMLQHDMQLKVIAKSLEKKIRTELKKLMTDDREKYEKFFSAFGTQLKYGVYENYGQNKEAVQDLLIFVSSFEKKPVSLSEYVSRMPESQTDIYYACGETVDKIDMLPQTELLKEKGYEILYMTENVDEFALKMMDEYEGKKFKNICAESLDLSTDEEKEKLKEKNESAKSLLEIMKEGIGDSVHSVRFTNKLKNHPVCLTTEGDVSVEMEKVLNSLPNNGGDIHAKICLEINADHPIADKLTALAQSDPETLKQYAKILYAQARLIEGMSIENPTEISNLVCSVMAK
ncbi:MAG: molecular chaperone HtpG [Oscillospiraceae bacterium]|nr:molecular chaperone HtpG [Oscillospiraceae bacterium]